jgi:hypothetical protein
MTFTVVRAMEAISLVAIIGMTANFIQEMVASNQVPHTVLIGTLSVVSPSHFPTLPRRTNTYHQTCISVLYTLITYILYFDSQLPFLIALSGDCVLLIAVMVTAITVGKPLSYLNCAALSNTSSNSHFTGSFISSMGENMQKSNYYKWVGASKATCFEMKAIWGLSIALCVLFSVSAIVSGCMWKRQRGEKIVIKDVEGN